MAVTRNEENEYIVLNNTFSCLRWNIFEDISNIQVMNDPKSIDTNLTPFLGHEIGKEPATNILLTQIEFTSDVLDNHFDYDYTRPAAAIVKRADGGIVTIADVVEQLSPYFMNLKDEILMAEAPMVQVKTIHSGTAGDPWTTVAIGGDIDDVQDLPADTRVFFDGTFYGAEPQHPWFPIIFWVEGEDGHTVEDHWMRCRMWG